MVAFWLGGGEVAIGWVVLIAVGALFVGAAFGALIMALMVASGHADQHLEDEGEAER